MSARWWRWLLRGGVAGTFTIGVAQALVAVPVGSIADAITELDVERARQLLGVQPPPTDGLQLQRARLALYVGDCDSAEATARTLPPSPEVDSLLEVSQDCARAVAGAAIIEDQAQGVWLRLQDDRDRALVPRIVEVAVQARAAVERDLGITLPRPLRMDLVGDLFSLAAITGLPVEAAETTGTVAVARWGRVTMLSPRAAPMGYSWEDTLAHEIAHLGLSRATRDRAPLWLQEGVAKGEETRWRPARTFDERARADAVARNALVTGSSVGVDALGPSIAMLPSADAASIAFAEVKSFMDYFVRTVGRTGFHLLLADLKGIGQSDPNHALISVTGFDLDYWIARWQQWLMTLPKEAQVIDLVEAVEPAASDDPFELARRARLGALFFEAGHARLAGEQLERAVDLAPDQAALRFQCVRAWLAAGEEERAREALGRIEQMADLHGGWLALHGRFLRASGDATAAGGAFDLAAAVDPFSPEVACEGQSPGMSGGRIDSLPVHAMRQEICREFTRPD